MVIVVGRDDFDAMLWTTIMVSGTLFFFVYHLNNLLYYLLHLYDRSSNTSQRILVELGEI